MSQCSAIGPIQTPYAAVLIFQIEFSKMKTLIKLIKWEQQGYYGNTPHTSPTPALNPASCLYARCPSYIHPLHPYPSIYPLIQDSAEKARESPRHTLSFSIFTFPQRLFSYLDCRVHCNHAFGF